jgi:hypothetical protein
MLRLSPVRRHRLSASASQLVDEENGIDAAGELRISLPWAYQFRIG